MSVINTNVNALQASNASNSAAAMSSQAMTRLSTGKRINSAADDAAGMAIATSMTSQINSMNQGVKNANDGISLAQTAQGSLDEVTNMLQRVRTLAVQAQNSTYSSTDRTNMQSEVSALKTQINNIVTNTKFNGTAVFGAGASDVTFSIQAGNDAITLTSKALNWTSNSSSLDVSTSASTTVTTVDSLLGYVASTNATLGAGQNQLTSAVNNMTNTSTNLSAARSRIQDADYSEESTAMAKAQILSQASTAMIAQANQAQQNVLSLLK
ncbi:flagellin FliC [Novosphingobium umbonatum]|uniref:Flagellin n=1 Tax=Novosphingobium umbonatum TaxID=1908524 RepID=A0A3S2UXM7_9SPHN|nr:flagellin [Novosphingobium umbonatum]RVU07824.1 flagellin FliC [Novosphingobium umbonatum]